MAKSKLSLLDKELLREAANGWTGTQMEEEHGAPAAWCVQRVADLLEEFDIWDEIQQRKLVVKSMQRLKEQVESNFDGTDPKMLQSLTNLLGTMEQIMSKAKPVTDAEIEKMAVAQASQIIMIVESSFTRARQLLAKQYPEVDLGEIDAVFYEALRENTLQIEA